MGRLEGKVALITGGARGQGRSHAVTMAREGADVILVDIADQISTVPYDLASPQDLEETVRLVEDLDRRVIAIRGDIRSQEVMDQAVQRGIEQFGKVDILLANAGIFVFGHQFWEISDLEWHDTLDVNLTGAWQSVRAVARHMIERREGSIVFTASVNGLEPAQPYAAYVAAKHGVIGLMRSVAYELAPYNIRCNAVCPAAMDTPILNNPASYRWLSWLGESVDAETGDLAHMESVTRENVRHFNLLKGRSMLPPSAVSNAILWLVSDAAAHVTGVVLPVDAGHMILTGHNPAPTRQ